MAKPYKLTPIELALSPVEHFEDNLSKFLDNETIDDDKKLILLQDALRRVDKHYRSKPTAAAAAADPKKESSPQESPAAAAAAAAGTQLKKEELDSIVLKIGNLMPHSYREQSKRLLIYLLESGQIQVESNGERIIIQGKSYNLLDLMYDMVTNRKGLLSFDTRLYNFLNTLNFPKSLIGNRQILKKLNERASSSSTLKDELEAEEDFKSILENTSTPLIARQKRRRIKSTSPAASIQKGSGHYTTCLRSKWLKF